MRLTDHKKRDRCTYCDRNSDYKYSVRCSESNHFICQTLTKKNHSMRKLWEWINPICLSFFISSFWKFHWIIIYFYVSICLNTFLQLKQEFRVKKKHWSLKKKYVGSKLTPIRRVWFKKYFRQRKVNLSIIWAGYRYFMSELALETVVLIINSFYT